MVHPNTAAVNAEVAAVTATKSPGAPTEDRYYPKFRVIRRSTGDELDPTTTFTLLPHKDPHARKALLAYCESCQDELPGLARMLRQHFALE